MAKKLMDSIQMEVRDKGPCCKVLDFTVPADAVKAETDRTLQEFAGMVSIPGFRQGKAPAGLLKTKYAEEVKQELERRIMTTAFEIAGKDASLDIVSCGVEGQPRVEFDTEFKFVLNADLAPEFELGDYKAIKVDVPRDAVTEKEVEERIDTYRNMYGSYADVEGAAAKEDMLKVSYKSDFVLPEDAGTSLKRQVEAENTFLWLSDPEMIPGCTAALTGAEKGKEYSLKAAYPADYREAALAGKTVAYTIQVEGVQRRKALSDAELAEKARFKSIDEFRDTIRKAMEQENENKQRAAAVEQAFEALDKTIPAFELPPAVLASEVSKEMQKIARELVKSEEDVEKFKSEQDTHKVTAEADAKKSLRRTFILRKLGKAEEIELNSNEVNARLVEMSSYYGYKPKELRDMLEKNGGMEDLQLDIMNGKVLDRLAELATK